MKESRYGVYEDFSEVADEACFYLRESFSSEEDARRYQKRWSKRSLVPLVVFNMEHDPDDLFSV